MTEFDYRHNSAIVDPYVKERWTQFHTDMIKEYKILVEMHSAMQKFSVSLLPFSKYSK
jgi:hypothetical protein